MSKASFRALLTLVTVSGLVSSCRKAEPVEPAPDDAETAVLETGVVARVNGHALLADDVAFAKERALRSGEWDGTVEALVESAVERELMLQRSREWAVTDVEVQREVENLLLSRWLERTLSERERAVDVTDEVLRAEYERRAGEFSTPLLYRLAILYRECNAKSSEETADAITAELEQGRDTFLADPHAARQGGRMTGFGKIAADCSEDAASRYRGGDIGWLNPESSYPRWPAEVLSAGYELDPNGISPVLRTENGLYVVMKTGIREARVTPFDDAAASLRRKMLVRLRGEARDAFLRELRSSSDVVIVAEEVLALKENMERATEAGSGSPPQLRPVSMVTPGAVRERR